jgi:hypothetical protein
LRAGRADHEPVHLEHARVERVARLAVARRVVGTRLVNGKTAVGCTCIATEIGRPSAKM